MLACIHTKWASLFSRVVIFAGGNFRIFSRRENYNSAKINVLKVGTLKSKPTFYLLTVYFFQIVSINFLQNSCFIENSNLNLDFKDGKIFPVRFCNEKMRQTGANLLHLPVINKNPPGFYLTLLPL